MGRRGTAQLSKASNSRTNLGSRRGNLPAIGETTTALSDKSPNSTGNVGRKESDTDWDKSFANWIEKNPDKTLRHADKPRNLSRKVHPRRGRGRKAKRVRCKPNSPRERCCCPFSALFGM